MSGYSGIAAIKKILLFYNQGRFQNFTSGKTPVFLLQDTIYGVRVSHYGGHNVLTYPKKIHRKNILMCKI